MSKNRRYTSLINRAMSDENHRFYLSEEWLNVRRVILNHYGRRCCKCKTTNGYIQVDHILPRSLHPELSLELSNLQPLCSMCNNAKSNIDFTDYRITDSVLKQIPKDYIPLTDDQLYAIRAGYVQVTYGSIVKRKARPPKRCHNKPKRYVPDNPLKDLKRDRNSWEDPYNKDRLTAPRGDYISEIFCRVYKCQNKPISGTPHCGEHRPINVVYTKKRKSRARVRLF